jgi:hypothetical protein
MLWFQDLTGSAMYGFLRVSLALFTPSYTSSILVHLGPNYERTTVNFMPCLDPQIHHTMVPID